MGRAVSRANIVTFSDYRTSPIFSLPLPLCATGLRGGGSPFYRVSCHVGSR